MKEDLEKEAIRVSTWSPKEERATRHNSGKPDWNLVDWQALEPLVQSLKYGENNYGRLNWKKGLDQTETLNSLTRHIFALHRGEIIDPSDGIPHIGKVFANAMFWSHFHQKSEKEKLSK